MEERENFYDLNGTEMDSEFDLDALSGGSITRKLSILKHRKKQAANDAQLLMNRIALLQKEEERARKKIDQTKDRAKEILEMKSENEKKLQLFADAANEERLNKRDLQVRNKEQEIESRRARIMNAELIYNKKREDVCSMQKEKKSLTKIMIQEQERELKQKQSRREDVRRQELEARQRREEERREMERKMKEQYDRKAQEEEFETIRAEHLVKLLERKEKEWIEKLQSAQETQKDSIEKFENALIGEIKSMPPEVPSYLPGINSTPPSAVSSSSSKNRSSSAKKSRGKVKSGTPNLSSTGLSSSSSRDSHF